MHRPSLAAPLLAPTLVLVLVLVLGLALPACTKNEAPAPPEAGTVAAPGAGPRTNTVDKALADPNNAAVQRAKGAILAQQCSLACGAKLGIDSGACTNVCLSACANETTVAAIDTCASQTADKAPQL